MLILVLRCVWLDFAMNDKPWERVIGYIHNTLQMKRLAIFSPIVL